MAFAVNVDIKRQFEVDCDFDTVFDVLSDVPVSVSHFPDMDQLVDLGDNVYRWEMKKIGIDKYAIQTVYACRYTDNREKGWVKWTPVKGEGNGQVKGKWKIKELKKGGVRIELETGGELTLPFPKLARIVVAPLVVREFNRLVDRYIENLTETFEAEE